MNWNDVKKIIRKEIHKESTEVKEGGSKFTLRTGVNKNPTKLGIKIQFEPVGGGLESDTKNKLEVALQERLNDGLGKYKIQVSKDTDVPREDVIGFFIPLSQLKALIIEGLGQGDAPTPSAPAAPEPEGEEQEINEMILKEMRIRELNEISRVVKKEDFYEFINKGNNILRDLEGAGMNNGKKYLIYLIKHNIM